MNTVLAPPMKIGSEIAMLIIEMVIRKSGLFLFLLKIRINAVKISTAKTAAFTTAILESTGKVTSAFPIGL
jgi:predicted nucleic-acid-binding protein